jgi:hypothetical protein
VLCPWCSLGRLIGAKQSLRGAKVGDCQAPDLHRHPDGITPFRSSRDKREDSSSRVWFVTRVVKLPRRLRRLGIDTAVTADGPRGSGRGWSQRQQGCRGDPYDRATSVPFTAVLTGLERTTTDNATATLTCAVPCLRR